jgi:hypothetical protein
MILIEEGKEKRLEHPIVGPFGRLFTAPLKSAELWKQENERRERNPKL